MDGQPQAAQHLAWHETLDTHELVAMQSNGLMDLKMALPHVKDRALRALYIEAIQGIETNLRELIRFYSQAPVAPAVRNEAEEPRADMTAFYVGKLHSLAKTSVRTYSLAITESATPALRETFHRHLEKGIALHGKVFAYMYQHGYYPAYHLDQLLGNDLKMANKALSM